MNNIFNLRRFGLYAQKEFHENWKALALGIVALIVGSLLEFFNNWNFVQNYPFKHQFIVPISPYGHLMSSMVFSIIIVSSYVFKDFAVKNRTLAYITLPASTFEKFLFAWLIAVPFTVFCCYSIWKTSWAIFTPIIGQAFPKHVEIRYDNDYWDGYESVIILTASGAFAVGALMLKRLSLLKTIGILMVAGWLVYGVLSKWLGKIWFDNANVALRVPVPWFKPQLQVIYSSNFTPHYFDLPTTYEPIYKFWWIAFLPLILWAIAYLKIKEKEV